MSGGPRRRQAKQYVKNRIHDRAQETAFRSRRADQQGSDRLCVLLVTDFKSYTSDQQYAPVARNADLLFSEHGLNVAVMSLEGALARGKRFVENFDVVGLKLVFKNAEPAVVDIAEQVRDAMRPEAKLVYFDGDDDLNVQWVRLLGLVDSYVKKHAFAEVDDYARAFRGKSNLTDYVSEVFGGHLLDAETIMHSGPVPPELRGRIRVGWNVGLDDPIHALATTMVSPAVRRDIDVSGRAIGQEDRWVAPLRGTMKEKLRQIEGRSVAVPEARVPRSEYFAEMRTSKICVSPYGFGEICWRDFEAVASGCLLVKPDMSHLRTEPDIYVPGVTYVPVAWDYSDLEAACVEYLEDSSARERMVLDAQRVLSEAQRAGWLADRLAHVLPGA